MTRPQIRPKTAMVLAAGLGQRMRPLTETRPKPLLELGGRTLLDHVLDRLVAAGVEKAVVNVHYLADQIEAHVKTRRAPEIVIQDERDRLLDTGGGVKRALPLLGDDPFFVVAADTVWTEGARANLSALAAGFDPERMDVALLLAPTASSLGYAYRGDFSLGEDGRLARRGDRDHVPFAYASALLLHPRIYEDTPDGVFSNTLIFDRAEARGRLYGLPLDGEWMHVGTPDALTEAEEALRKRPGERLAS